MMRTDTPSTNLYPWGIEIKSPSLGNGLDSTSVRDSDQLPPATSPQGPSLARPCFAWSWTTVKSINRPKRSVRTPGSTGLKAGQPSHSSADQKGIQDFGYPPSVLCQQNPY